MIQGMSFLQACIRNISAGTLFLFLKPKLANLAVNLGFITVGPHSGEYHVYKPQEYPDPLATELQDTPKRVNPARTVS